MVALGLQARGALRLGGPPYLVAQACLAGDAIVAAFIAVPLEAGLFWYISLVVRVVGYP